MSGGRFIMATEQNIRLAVLWDLDGVLADNSHAMSGHTSYWHLSEDEWDHYFTLLGQCEVIEGWSTLFILMHERGYANIIVTNRSETQRETTTLWLKENGLLYDLLLMRPENAAHVGAKRDAIERIRQDYIAVLAVDDDPEHCADYEAAGIPTLYVHSGYHMDQPSIATPQ